MPELLKDKKVFTPDLMDKKYSFEESGSFSIAIVGDLHLHHSTFRSRTDNYPETTINKLGILRRELLAKGIKYLVCLGDIFHIPKERTDYEFAVIQEFIKFRESGIQVFSISGNHDIPNERLELIDKTSLGILFLTETVKPFTGITFKRPDGPDVVLTGFNFPNAPCPAEDKAAFNICVSHRFFDSSLDPDNSVTKADLELLGYNMYALGHDHVVYDFEKIPTSRGLVGVIRPGSFMRATSHNYNTHRMVYFDEIIVENKVEVIRHTLPVRPPEEVFPTTAINKDELLNLGKVSKELANLVSQIYESDSIGGSSVYDVLDSSPIETPIKDRITVYLEANGIYRKNNSLSLESTEGDTYKEVDKEE